MAKFCENGKEWESFVWKPRKPSCLNKDDSRDYEKLNALIKQAQEWNHETLMLVFEQYSGTWMSMCSQSDEVMYRLAMDFEDFQQEAFCCFLKTIKELHEDQPENFKKFFLTNLKNTILDLLKNIEKQVIGHTNVNFKDGKEAKQFSYSVCSLQETNEDGSMKYDIPADTENDYFTDYYPHVKSLLTERELKIAILHFVDGISLKTVSKQLGVSYRTVKYEISTIKESLQVLR